MRVLIMGAGGHAQVVADILLRMEEAGAELTPIGYLDDNSMLVGRTFLGLPVLGTQTQLSAIAHDALIVAIGDNQTRRRLFETLLDRGEHFVTARHPGATIAADVQIGPGSMICAGVVVNPGSVIGANVILNTGCTIDHHNHIGDHVHIAPGVHLGGEVSVDEGTLIGIGTIIVPRRSIGAWAVIGAGSVVTKDIPAHATAVGIPARIVKKQDDDCTEGG